MKVEAIIADVRKFTFSAATLIQNEPTDLETWQDITHDLERAAKAAQAVANILAKASDDKTR